MTNSQDANRDETRCWLELANGGGVMFREPGVTEASEPQYKPHRQPKRLEAPAPALRGKVL